MFEQKINWKAVIKLLVIAVVAGGFSYIIQPIVKSNDPIMMLATILSILAGFIMVLVTILSDPSQFTKAGWRKVATFKPIIEKELTKQEHLFMGYLVTLFMIFFSMLLKEQYTSLSKWLMYFYLWLGFICMWYSLFLPSSIRKAQLKKLDQLIKYKKELAKKVNHDE